MCTYVCVSVLFLCVCVHVETWVYCSRRFSGPPTTRRFLPQAALTADFMSGTWVRLGRSSHQKMLRMDHLSSLYVKIILYAKYRWLKGRSRVFANLILYPYKFYCPPPPTPVLSPWNNFQNVIIIEIPLTMFGVCKCSATNWSKAFRQGWANLHVLKCVWYMILFSPLPPFLPLSLSPLPLSLPPWLVYPWRPYSQDLWFYVEPQWPLGDMQCLWRQHSSSVADGREHIQRYNNDDPDTPANEDGAELYKLLGIIPFD